MRTSGTRSRWTWDVSPPARPSTAILLGYDNPEATEETRFGGWIDDLSDRPAAGGHRRLRPDQLRRRPTRHELVRVASRAATTCRSAPCPTGSPSSHRRRTRTPARGSTTTRRRTTRRTCLCCKGSPSRTSRAHGWATATSCPSCRPSPRASRRARHPVADSPSTMRPRSPGPTTTRSSWRAVRPTEASAPRRLLPTTAVSSGSPSPSRRRPVTSWSTPSTTAARSPSAAGSNELTGWVDNGSGLSAGRSRMFVYGTFDRPVTAAGTAPAGHTGTRYATFDVSSDRAGGPHAGDVVHLARPGSSQPRPRARRARLRRGPSRGEPGVERAARRGGRRGSQRQRSDDALLEPLPPQPLSQQPVREHRHRLPSRGTSTRARCSPKSGAATPTQTNAAVKDGRIYVNNGFWDTYRTVWPAYSLLYPEVAAEIADGFVQQYRDGGWVARWSSPGYADLMTGTSSDVAFADAYVKGVPLPDPLGTYDAALKNATVAADVERGRPQGARHVDLPRLHEHEHARERVVGPRGTHQRLRHRDHGRSSSPRTRRPRRRGEPGSPRSRSTSCARATNYVNVFDDEGRLLPGPRLRTAASLRPSTRRSGAATTPRRTAGTSPSTHRRTATAWPTSTAGGRPSPTSSTSSSPRRRRPTKPGSYGGTIHEMLEARDVRMGQLGQSNQVSHHIPYMYVWTGQQWKTAEKVREIMRRLYVGVEIGQGYPGDEDNGEMSAWYVLSALGIYPLQVGSPEWAIGSPKFEPDDGAPHPGRPRRHCSRQLRDEHLRPGRHRQRQEAPERLDQPGGARPGAPGSTSRWAPVRRTSAPRTQDAPPSLTQGTEAPKPLQGRHRSRSRHGQRHRTRRGQ